MYKVAKHIYDLNIDERLENGDLSLINDIAINTFNDKQLRFYSFATKYCANHYPDKFPIYDSFVDLVLRRLRKRDNLLKFKNDDLKNYFNFKDIIDDFIRVYNFPKDTSYRDLDIYLWLLGKDVDAGIVVI